jgi:hypothetical protein
MLALLIAAAVLFVEDSMVRVRLVGMVAVVLAKMSWVTFLLVAATA